MSKKRIGRARTLTAEEVRAILDYDQETGRFTWKSTTYNHHAGTRAGGINNDGYEVVQFGGYKVLGHLLAWLWMTGAWPSDQIDHQDEVKNNNCWTNLRLADSSKNKQNVRMVKSNTSGFRGVSWHKRDQRWRANICYLGVRRELGRFDTPEEAAAAYQAEAKRLFGEFAPAV